MIKKLKNTDFLFIISLSLILLVHIYFIFIIPFFEDESFYVSVPFRLINGDSLIQHEWHLTQFSSLFQYLPVYIWTAIKGSADSIIIFLRCVYLSIHTIIAIVIYIFFRKHGNWAIMASMMFFVQVPYRFIAISYQSVFVISLLLLSLFLLSIYQKSSIYFYIFAGICFGCCCVCNPLFCIVFALYLIICVLWTKRQSLASAVLRSNSSNTLKNSKKLTKRQKREQKQQILDAFPNMERYTCFFTKEAILWFSCGIFIITIIAFIFFLSTGGTISSAFENIENLLDSSEYDIVSFSIFYKLQETVNYFNMANLNMPWILPVLFIALLLDKRRKTNKHRFVYLSISILWSVLFVFAILKVSDFYSFAFSLPFFIFSTMCYLLTCNKNKTLFYCMYMPCLTATFFQYLAANTHLAAIGVILAISNIAGVLFAMDLWKEMRLDSQNSSETTKKQKTNWFRNIIIVGFSLQILFYGIFYQHEQVYGKDSPKASVGPYKGLYMTVKRYNEYNKAINDLDLIKNISQKYEPVLLASYNIWMYLYLDRPIATYTTCYPGTLEPELLISYYRENPEKIPKYIYYEDSNPDNVSTTMASEMFEFTRQDLSNGVLLTVTDCKFQ